MTIVIIMIIIILISAITIIIINVKFIALDDFYHFTSFNPIRGYILENTFSSTSKHRSTFSGQNRVHRYKK